MSNTPHDILVGRRPSEKGVQIPNSRKACIVERRRKRSDMGAQHTHPGADYTPDEIELMLAMDQFKRDRRRPHPDCRDILEVAKQLGYRKVEGGDHEPPLTS